MENYITTSNEIYIFKPTLLLKLWDNCYDVMDIRTFGDINKIFLIKLYLLQDNYVGAYKEVKFLIDDIGNFSPSISYHAFIYYLGKIIAGIIAQINDNYKLTREIKQIFDAKNLDFCAKITKVIIIVIIKFLDFKRI